MLTDGTLISHSNHVKHLVLQPPYPEALYQWLESITTKRDRVLNCVALGGTQVALRLAQNAGQVDLCDISGATAIYFPSNIKNIVCCELSPKQFLFADRTFDLITVVDTLHWFNLPVLWKEVDRLLTPSGLFVAWTFDCCSVTPDVDAAVKVFAAIIRPFWPNYYFLAWREKYKADCPLPVLTPPKFFLDVDWDSEQFVNFLLALPAASLCRQLSQPDVLNNAINSIRAAWGKEQKIRTVHFAILMLAAQKQRK